MGERRQKVGAKVELLSSGVQQLEAATAQVHKLEEELKQLEPVLLDKHLKSENLLRVRT